MRGRPSHEVVIEETRTAKLLRWSLAFLLLCALGAATWFALVYHRLPGTQQPIRAKAKSVKSEVTQQGDSLSVVVLWDLTSAPAEGVAESVRVEVGVGEGIEAQVSTSPASQRADTVRIPAPPAGGATQGYSCVAAVYQGRLTRDTCTPWQFVRPAAEEPAAGATKGDTTEQPKVLRIVVQPSGLQVDPDVGGRCAAWQRENRNRPVWVVVNERAVPECMGPNGKPTVAQFCAFAELTDGRRVKTENSAAVPYCERLFREWVRERIS